MRRLPIPRLWRCVAVAFGAFLWFGAVLAAGTAQTNFSQRILPLNCVFTVINAGTGELYYLTPTECGVVIPPPAPPSQGSSGQSSATNPTLGPGYPYPLLFAPSTTSSGGSGDDSSSQLVSPVQPITGAQNPIPTKSGAHHKSTFSLVWIICILITILLIVAVLFRYLGRKPR